MWRQNEEGSFDTIVYLRIMLAVWLVLVLLCLSYAYIPVIQKGSSLKRLSPTRTDLRFLSVRKNVQLLQSTPSSNGDEITEKYGLEAGMVNAMSNQNSENQKVKPKDLFAKYGIAYLVTSITLAIISYALCYVLISNGVDVAAVLERVGIKSTSVASNAGTVAIAYAMHKAASPIRFPPTVALTPVVARWIGRRGAGKEEKASQGNADAAK
jgi:hypothetical protein